MATARLDELKARFDENPRRYFAPYANELRKHGDFHQAIAICRTHLDAQPGHVSGYIVLAQALHEAGEIGDARAAFESALGIDPENLIALRYMGDIAREQGEIETARSWYSRVLDADPRNEEIADLLRTLTSAPNDSAPAAVPHAPPLMMGYDLPSTPVTRELDVGTADAAPPPQSALDDREPSSPPANEPPREIAGATSPATVDSSAPSIESSPQLPHEESSAEPPPPIDVYAPAPHDFDPATAEDAAASDVTEDLVGYDGDWAEEFERSFEDTTSFDEATEATDDLWEPKPTPAADFSDYEAAPDPFIDETVTFAPESAGPATDGDAAAPTPDAGSWFAENPPASDAAPEYQPDADTLAAPPSAPDPAPSAPRDDRAPAPADASRGRPREWSAAPSPTPESVVAGSPAPAEMPFVTETLAELYVQQGFLDEARAIYRQLIASDPTNESLRSRLEALERSDEPPTPVVAAPTSETARAGVSVRVFFGRLARRKPSRMAGGGGSGNPRAAAEETTPDGASDRAEEVRAAAPASDERREPSALSEMFTAAKPSPSDASAASTLASAFTDPPGQAFPDGRPARMAERELSLDHLFREAPRPASEPTTLDDFYANSQSGATPPAPDGAPGDEPSDDLQQFTAWLEGLRKK